MAESRARGERRKATTGGGPAKPSLREMQKELTRERVIESALEMFDEQGYASTTMDDIAVRANLNRGTIYLHFESKAEILRAALVRLRPAEFSLFERLDASETHADLEAVFDHTLDVWHEVGRIWHHARAAATTEATIREWTDAVFAQQREKTRRALVRRGAAEAAAASGSTLLVSMWSEFMARWAADQDGLERRETVLALVAIFLATTPAARGTASSVA
ncbi:MAG: TetR/AcrR family transcriptional regulator [Solirubrobacteraceae bacterium]